MRERSTGDLVDRHLAAAGVEAHRAHGEDLLVVLGDGHAPAQHGAHAGDQLPQPERLGHVVAGAELQPEHDVDLGVACRHHDDGHRLEAPHLLADLDAGLVGQHDVEQHEIGVHPVEQAQRLVPVPGRLDREALPGQARGQGLAVGLLVVDDEDEGSVVPARAGEGDRPLVAGAFAIATLRSASGSVVGTRGGVNGRGAGDDGRRGVDRTDVAWARGEANTRAMVTKDPMSPARCERAGRIMMTSARVSWPRWRSTAGPERRSRPS